MVPIVSIGAKPAKVTKYSINYKDIIELHALFFSCITGGHISTKSPAQPSTILYSSTTYTSGRPGRLINYSPA